MCVVVEGAIEFGSNGDFWESYGLLNLLPIMAKKMNKGKTHDGLALHSLAGRGNKYSHVCAHTNTLELRNLFYNRLFLVLCAGGSGWILCN